MSYPPAISYPNSPGWSRWIERLRAATAGRFTILRELGRGGFAAVFLAQQHQPNRRVAIKLLLPAHLDSEWALEHFRGESQKIAQWRHQSVVTIYEVHEEEDLFYFVMSYVEGASLHEILQVTGPLPVPVVKSVLAHMGSALSYAHRQGVTHRDVKPQNVLIDTDGGAVMADFGIAKQQGGPSVTVTGMIFGTAPYMAPEQCESGATSTQSDQYALGIVVYEMLTGSPPFTGPATSVLVAHLQKEVPLLRTVRPDCPPELEAAVARMLSKKPEDRFPSIAEAIHSAGALELPEFDPQRQAFARVAKELAAQQQAQELDIVSIPPQIEVGDRINVQATLRTNSGESLDTGRVKWSVDNSDVVDLDTNARALQAREPGFTTLFVRSGGLEKQIRVEVVPPRVHAIEITAPPTPLPVGERTQLAARAVSKNGIPITGDVSWSVDDPAIALIAPDGTVQGRTPGRTRIRAQLEHVTAEVEFHVALPAVTEVRITGLGPSLAVGERRQATAVLLGANGQTLGDRLLMWTSSDPHVATVSASGIVTAHQTGSVSISAQCEEAVAAHPLEVSAPKAAAVEIQGPAVARVGDEVQLHAIVRDAMGRVIESEVTWQSDEPEVARVSADGVVSALGPGSAIISVTVDGVSAATLLDVAVRGASGAVPIRKPTPGATELFTAGGVAQAAAESELVGAAAAAPKPSAAIVRAPSNKPAFTREEKKSSRTGMFAGVGVAALLAIAAGVYTFSGGDDAESAATGSAASADSLAVQPVASTDGDAPPVGVVPAAGDTAQTQTASPGASTSSSPTRLDIAQPVSTRLTVGQNARLRASTDQGAARNARWSSSNPSVLQVASDGTVQAAGAGRAYVRVRDGALADSVAFEVEAAQTVAAADSTPPAPPVTTPVNTQPVVDEAAKRAEREGQLRDQVRHIVNQYAKALEDARLPGVLQIYPSMDQRTQDGWNLLFRSVRDLDVNMRVDGPININGNRGTARVSGEYLYVNPSNRRRCRQQVVMMMTFDKLDVNAGQIADIKQESSQVSDC